MKEPEVKIALADDEILFRKGISFLLQREPHFKIVFEAGNGEEIVQHLEQTSIVPDVILMDLKMPALNGVEATKIIRKEFPEINIIALTSYNTKTFIANMIKVGASSYLIKNATPKEVVHTINEVVKKGFHYDEHVMRIIHEDLLNEERSLKGDLEKNPLTKREKEILSLICKQYTTGEIAEKLFISPRTVEGHRNNLLLKTESKNTAGLVIYGIQKKLININADEQDFFSGI